MSKSSERKPLNIVQALSAGFDAVTRAPQVMLIPVLFDLFLWLGPRLSAYPLIKQALDLMSSLPQSPEAAVRDQTAQMQTVIAEVGQQFNLFAWLSPTLIGVPSLMAGILSDQQPWLRAVTVWEVDSGLACAGLFILFGLLGLGLSALYWSQITQVTVQDPPGRNWLARAGRLWWGLIKLVIMLTVLSVLIGLPVLFAVTLAALFSPILGQMLVMLWPALLLWVTLYLAFTLHGLALHDKTLIEAVRVSLILTRTQSLQAIGLLLVGLLIYFGLSMIWTLPAGDSWLRAGGIVGSAFIASGVWCATAFFYLDRTAALAADKQPAATDPPTGEPSP